jgi:hypothetical protein
MHLVRQMHLLGNYDFCRAGVAGAPFRIDADLK